MKHFLKAFLLTAIIFTTFFAWELGYFGTLLPRLPRPIPTQTELLFTVVLILLLSINSGLVWFRMKQGTCPIGARRASTLAGGLGVITLLCPACLLIPVSLFGLSLSLTFLSPYLPLLRVIVVLLLVVSLVLLWPKRAVNS